MVVKTQLLSKNRDAKNLRKAKGPCAHWFALSARITIIPNNGSLHLPSSLLTVCLCGIFFNMCRRVVPKNTLNGWQPQSTGCLTNFLGFGYVFLLISLIAAQHALKAIRPIHAQLTLKQHPAHTFHKVNICIGPQAYRGSPLS
jgi:hypothetical protein